MSILKKKKPIGEFIIEPPKFVPEVIKESKIKPTKCRQCFSIYQANHTHLIRELDFSMIDKVNTLTVCPVCGCKNFVEFEEADNETKAD